MNLQRTQAPQQQSPEAAENWNPDAFIEADDHELDDIDSTLGDDIASSTTSLRSTVTRYVQENGRRYHAPKEGLYLLPNDEVSCSAILKAISDINKAELDRLDLFHECLRLRAGGELHLAPLGPDPQRILDLGTGSGIWATEMGDKYPSAVIIGNDISPVQPTLVPPNVFFEIDDIENDWVYDSNFDFIHSRCLVAAIKDWPRLIGQAYQFLMPRGWLEIAEIDLAIYTTQGEFSDECPAGIWVKKLADGVRALGLEPYPITHVERWMKDAGFVNVRNVLLPLPLGPWPKDRKLKEIGSYNLLNFLDGMEAFCLRIFTNVYKWEVEEVRVFLAQVRKDFLNPKTQIQHDFRIVYGQKPPATG